MSSFKRAGTSKPARKPPPATRPSLANGQLLTSMGVDAIDHLLGGGLAVGSVFLIEAQAQSPYPDVLLKYFLSQGICHHHHVTFMSADSDPSKFLKSCPRTTDTLDLPAQSKPASEQPSDMKIAWRYKNLPKVSAVVGTGAQSTFSKKFCHTFNLSQQVAEKDLQGDNIRSVDLRISKSDNTFQDAMAMAHEAIEPFRMVPQPGPLVSEAVQRVGIHLLGSGAWDDGCSHPHSAFDMNARVNAVCSFLHRLRGVARRSCAVFVVTVPDSLMLQPHHQRRMHMLADAVVRLDGFAGTPNEHHPALKEYHGFFKALRLPQLNSLVPSSVDTADLVFKLKKKEFVIEKFHLPPELSDTASRPQEDATPVARSGPSTRTRPSTKTTALVGGGAPTGRMCQPNPTKKDVLDF